MNRHLVVFAKAPEAGSVKTRLCPPLSPCQAAALAEAFLRDVLALAQSLPDCELVLCYTPRGTRERMRRLAPRGWRLRLQRGADLGERLGHLMAELLDDPSARVVVLGSDSPQLPPATVAAAYAALERRDLVLGPTEDGGYYLIGLRRWTRGLFDGVRWSTNRTLADTLERTPILGLSCELLEEGYDVDDIAGLRRLLADLDRLPPDRLPHTRAAVAALRLR
jgi:rSAM/selenodomain-associated transferase 1